LKVSSIHESRRVSQSLPRTLQKYAEEQGTAFPQVTYKTRGSSTLLGALG